VAWIPSFQELADHPKTRKLCRLLQVSRPAVVGHLHMLWWWALDYTDDGYIGKYEAADIADAVMWDGDPQQLLDALIASGFVDEDLQIHDWQDYQGRILAKREQNRERQKRFRESRVSDTSSHALVTRYSRVSNDATRHDMTRHDMTRHDMTRHDTTQHDRTEHDMTEPESSPKAPMTPKEKPRPRFPDDSEPAKLVTTLRGLIIGNNPTARAAKMTVRECDNWAEDFERLIRIDGRDPPTIEAVMRWAQADPFWKANILSPKKLREKWDTLWLQMQRPEKQGGNNGKARGSPGEGDADSSLDRFKRFD
jgi:hypothetical protein